MREALILPRVHTSLVSTGLIVELLESSRSRLGVKLIFRVSTPSSLKNESVLRTVPFLDVDESWSADVNG